MEPVIVLTSTENRCPLYIPIDDELQLRDVSKGGVGRQFLPCKIFYFSIVGLTPLDNFWVRLHRQSHADSVA